MANVFAHTARVHCPDWTLDMDRLPMPRSRPPASESQVANTAKLEHWCEAVRRASDGDELLLIDADTAILRPLEDIWDRPFDLAYTVRPADYPHPLNGGVVFIRVSTLTRAWMEAWRTANARMLRERALRDEWRKYAGMNQRAFGLLLETQREQLGGALLELPCHEWNCEDSAWASFDPAVTRILHIKSALRKAILPQSLRQPATPHLVALARRWRALESEAKRALATTGIPA